MGIRFVNYRVEEFNGKFRVIKDEKGKSSIILHVCPTVEDARRLRDKYAGPKRKRKRSTNGSSNAKLSTGSG